MRGQHNVIHAQQLVGNNRLSLEYVQRSTGYASALQGFDEGLLIYYWSASRVDQISLAFHQPQLSFTYKVVSVFVERAMEGDEIGSVEQFVHWHVLSLERFFYAGIGQAMPLSVYRVHIETARPPRHSLPNAA